MSRLHDLDDINTGVPQRTNVYSPPTRPAISPILDNGVASPQPNQQQTSPLNSDDHFPFEEKSKRFYCSIGEKLGQGENKKILKFSGPTAHAVNMFGGEACKNAIVTGVKVHARHNEFPYTMQYTIVGPELAPHSNFTNGSAYSFILCAGQSATDTITIFDNRDALKDQITRRFANVTPESIKKDIVTFQEGFCYVPREGSVGRTYWLNKSRFGEFADAETTDLGNKYLKLPMQTVNDVVNELTTSVLGKVKKMDLTKFQLIATRVDGKNLDELSKSSWSHYDDTEKKLCTETFLSTGCEIEIFYALPKGSPSLNANSVTSGRAVNVNLGTTSLGKIIANPPGTINGVQ